MTAFVYQIGGGEDETRKRQALELYQVTPSSRFTREIAVLIRSIP